MSSTVLQAAQEARIALHKEHRAKLAVALTETKRLIGNCDANRRGLCAERDEIEAEIRKLDASVREPGKRTRVTPVAEEVVA